MGEANRRKAAGGKVTQWRASNADLPRWMPPHPDLGEHLWSVMPEATRAAEVSILNCYASVMAASPEGGWELTFLVDKDRVFCGTVHTQQSREELHKIIYAHPHRVVIVCGRLADEEVVGNSGEVYRMIVGRVEPMPDFGM
jgi:hypothetical protein